MLVRMLGGPGRDHGRALLLDVLCRGQRVSDLRVLDVCAGTGGLAIAAARAGARSVTAVDISPRATAVAWCNARRRHAAVTVRRGDLFGPVRGRRFDVVVARPPHVPDGRRGPGRHRRQPVHDPGPDGRQLVDRLIAGLPDVLAFGGRALIAHSGLCGLRATFEALAAQRMTAEVVACATVPFRPAVRARAAQLERLGLIAAGQVEENLFVVEGRLLRRCSRGRPRVDITEEGPVLVHGGVDVMAPDGSTTRTPRVVTALCGCGRSRRLPFCDTSHRDPTPPAGGRP